MGRPKKVYSSITILVKELLKKTKAVKYEETRAKVKHFFPTSRFNERHFSWYKSAYKRGALKGVR